MKTLSKILIACTMLTTSYAFVAPIDLKAKCDKSDAIVRGVVVDIVTVAKDIKDSRGSDQKILEGEWTGPSSVAIVRVVSVLKGDIKSMDTMIFVPCGYGFDESPCELTKSKDYILFLKSMGHNYYHPVNPFSMHRVQKDMVGMGGFDWEGDFEPKSKNGEAITLEEFTKRIVEAKKE